MAEILGTYRNYGVVQGGDINDYINTGGYHIRPNDYEYSNTPDNNNAALLVFKSSDSSYVVQFYMTLYSKLFVRIKTNNWQSWKEFAFL